MTAIWILPNGRMMPVSGMTVDQCRQAHASLQDMEAKALDEVLRSLCQHEGNRLHRVELYWAWGLGKTGETVRRARLWMDIFEGELKRRGARV